MQLKMEITIGFLANKKTFLLFQKAVKQIGKKIFIRFTVNYLPVLFTI